MGNKKIFLIIGIFLLAISIPAAIFLLGKQTIFRLGAQTPNKPDNIQIAEITEQTATITWTTKSPTQGLVGYGLSPANLSLIQPEVAPAVNHRLNLVGLLPGSNYFFVIKEGEKTFDNNGQPYTFTTKAKEATPAKTLTEEGLQAAMGTNNPEYDLNKDGVVNTLDLLLLREQSK